MKPSIKRGSIFAIAAGLALAPVLAGQQAEAKANPIVKRNITWVAYTQPGDKAGDWGYTGSASYPQYIVTGDRPVPGCGQSFTFQTDEYYGRQSDIEDVIRDGKLIPGEDSKVAVKWKIEIVKGKCYAPASKVMVQVDWKNGAGYNSSDPMLTGKGAQRISKEGVTLAFDATTGKYAVKLAKNAGWEVKVIEPNQRILCGINYGKACKQSYTFAVPGVKSAPAKKTYLEQWVVHNFVPESVDPRVNPSQRGVISVSAPKKIDARGNAAGKVVVRSGSTKGKMVGTTIYIMRWSGSQGKWVHAGRAESSANGAAKFVIEGARDGHTYKLVAEDTATSKAVHSRTFVVRK